MLRVIVLVFLVACASTKLPLPQKEEMTKPHYRLIYLVHGDANYLYHDSLGNRHEADQEAINQATDIAIHSEQTEVFIFHQKAKQFNWFAKNTHGDFFHYYSGKLLQHEQYSRMGAGEDYIPEINLLKPFKDSTTINFLIYFGHEIPLLPLKGYSQSFPEREFSLLDFSRNLKPFSFSDPRQTNPAKPFALIVLSSCYSGTPQMLLQLLPLTQYVLASPSNLHLSYLDTHAFLQLPKENSTLLDSMSIHEIATSIAKQSFDSLKKNAQTEITLALYNTEKITPYLSKTWNTKSSSITSRNAGQPFLQTPSKYRDCNFDPAFESVSATVGTQVWFRAPLFGTNKNRIAHSGWECVTP